MHPSELFNYLYETCKKASSQPHYFGLGFIQIKTSFHERFHFYHPEFGATIDYENELHDHRYDFTSYVLKGSINNKKYKILLCDPGVKGTHKMTKESCNPTIKTVDNEHYLCNVELIEDFTIKAGESYFMHYQEMHTVKPGTAGCVTRLVRSDYKQDLANVARPCLVGVYEHTCPFDAGKLLGVDDCWDLIKSMCD